MTKNLFLTPEQMSEINARLADGYARRRRNFVRTGLAVLSISLLVWLSTGAPNFAMAAAVFALLIVGCVPALNRPITIMQAQTKAMQTLASVVKGAYVRQRKLINYPKVPLFVGLGWFKREEHGVAFRVSEVPVEMFVYTYRHPFENRYDRKKLRVIRIVLSKDMPHVLVRSKESGVLGKLDEHIPSSERVRVESEFEKKFDVYTHRRTASDALALLAPNLLATMLDYGQGLDVEIIGDSIYIYSAAETFSSVQAGKELVYVAKLIDTFKHKLKNYRLVLPNANYPYMTSQPSAGTAHVGDMRLTGGWAFLAIYWATSIGQVAIGWKHRSHTENLVRLSLIAAFSVLIAIFMIFRRRKRQ